MQIYYEFFISATISSPKMTRDSNELRGQRMLEPRPDYSLLGVKKCASHAQIGLP